MNLSMRKFITYFGLVFIGVSSASGLDRRVDGASALAEVTQFVESCTPRVSGTPGARAAAVYLQNRLSEFGYSAELMSFSDEGKSFFNVHAKISGESLDRIVLVSHFDTKGGISPSFQGANDSGSSTGLLLELARQLAGQQLAYTIDFVFVDGEECAEQYSVKDGLHGSEYYARYLRKQEIPVRAVIVADMVGDQTWGIELPSNSTPALLGVALQSAHELGLTSEVSIGQPMIDDHVPFLEYGFPSIDLIDFSYGTMQGNEFWHTEEDSLDKLSAESLAKCGQLILKMIDRISEGISK